MQAPQKADTFPKWWCQKSGARSGKMAMDSNMPAKGITHQMLSSPPSKECAVSAAKAGDAISRSKMKGKSNAVSFERYFFNDTYPPVL